MRQRFSLHRGIHGEAGQRRGTTAIEYLSMSILLRAAETRVAGHGGVDTVILYTTHPPGVHGSEAEGADGGWELEWAGSVEIKPSARSLTARRRKGKGTNREADSAHLGCGCGSGLPLLIPLPMPLRPRNSDSQILSARVLDWQCACPLHDRYSAYS